MGGLDAKMAGALIGKGVAMGIVHVLTGKRASKQARRMILFLLRFLLD
jgi:hypothetical protein